MSFRWRLYLGLVSAVVMTATLYALFGFLAFKRTQELDVRYDLATFRQAVLASLDLSGAAPAFRPTSATLAVLESFSDSGFQLRQGGRVLLAFGRPQPGATSGWRQETVALPGGFEVLLALNVSANRQALASYGQTALVALVLALGFAALVGWLLQGVLLRPLRELQRGVEQLSAQAIPAPVRVPPGDDELSRLALSFNRMIGALRAFIERERSFTRYASHELRTPLANVKALGEGMRRSLLEPQDGWPQFEASVERMERILSVLLSLTRAPELRPEPVPLESLLTRACQALTLEQRARVTLVRQASPCVLGDDELLLRVLSNLVQNALKYGGGEVVVRLDRGVEGAILSVRDFGPGVPEEALGKLTEPFFRLDQQQPGLGLGLALARHIVGAMSGALRFRNARPGFEATVVLPELDLPEANEPPLSSSQV